MSRPLSKHALVTLDKVIGDAAYMRTVAEWTRAWGTCRCGRSYRASSKQEVRELHRVHLDEEVNPL